MTNEQKKARDRRQAKFDAANTTRVQLKLNNNTDADIIDKLNSVPSKQGYIKEAVREKMKRDGL